MRCVVTAVIAALVICLGSGCGDSREKGKNKELDRPKPAEQR